MCHSNLPTHSLELIAQQIQALIATAPDGPDGAAETAWILEAATV